QPRSGSATHTPCPNAGRRAGPLPPGRPAIRDSTDHSTDQPNAPSTTITRNVGASSASSRSSQGRQVSRSSIVGLLAGGAQCTGAVIRTPYRVSPSSALVETGWLASPARYSAAYSHSPLRSPVNIRPVRFAPCAAGARPTTQIRASTGPNPGTGRPQDVWSANAARPGPATSSRHSTSRGQARQDAIRRSSVARSAAEPANARTAAGSCAPDPTATTATQPRRTV